MTRLRRASLRLSSAFRGISSLKESQRDLGALWDVTLRSWADALCMTWYLATIGITIIGAGISMLPLVHDRRRP